MRQEYPGIGVLVTTGTVSAAKLMTQRAPDVMHQFIPSEAPKAISSFLEHWKPDLAAWVESELWPNMLSQTAGQGIPVVLMNGRMSEKFGSVSPD
jgi:3-deoxy-D-manno-octulosonic-acid transferase